MPEASPCAQVFKAGRSSIDNLTAQVIVADMSDRKMMKRLWRGMLTRCDPRMAPCFPRYSGRGITVCERWLKSFDAFFADMGQRPAGTSLDRIDNDRGYSPDNCRWATRTEQNNNKSCNILFPYNGRQLTAAQITRESGSSLSVNVVTARMRLGWTAERATSEPLQEERRETAPRCGCGTLLTRGRAKCANCTPRQRPPSHGTRRSMS